MNGVPWLPVPRVRRLRRSRRFLRFPGVGSESLILVLESFFFCNRSLKMLLYSPKIQRKFKKVVFSFGVLFFSFLKKSTILFPCPNLSLSKVPLLVASMVSMVASVQALWPGVRPREGAAYIPRGRVETFSTRLPG